MRKRLIDAEIHPQPEADSPNWLDLGSLASVEVTSEHPDFPVESAFTGQVSGWRANGCGEQTIRLVFDEPTAVNRIQLRFHESQIERTHEFTLSYQGQSDSREIVRQQWSFSPQGSTSEQAKPHVNSGRVISLELKLKPDLQPERAVASLTSFRVS